MQNRRQLQHQALQRWGLKRIALQVTVLPGLLDLPARREETT
jgi:hypothetical protein